MASLRFRRLLGHELHTREQRPLRLAPPVVDQQRLGFSSDLPGLGENRLDRVGVFLTGDDLAGQGKHQVVAVGGEPFLRQLALDGEGALPLLRHQLEGVSREGVPVVLTGLEPLRELRRPLAVAS